MHFPLFTKEEDEWMGFIFDISSHNNRSGYESYEDASDAFWDGLAYSDSNLTDYNVYAKRTIEYLKWLHSVNIPYTIGCKLKHSNEKHDIHSIMSFYINIPNPRHAVLFKLKWG